MSISRQRIMQFCGSLTDDQIEYVMHIARQLVGDSTVTSAPIKDAVQLVDEKMKQGAHPLEILKDVMEYDPEPEPEPQTPNMEHAMLLKFLNQKGYGLPANISIDSLRTLAKNEQEAAPTPKPFTPPVPKAAPLDIEAQIWEKVKAVVGPTPSDMDKETLNAWREMYTPIQILNGLETTARSEAYSLRHTNGLLKSRHPKTEAAAGGENPKQVGRFRFD